MLLGFKVILWTQNFDTFLNSIDSNPVLNMFASKIQPEPFLNSFFSAGNPDSTMGQNKIKHRINSHLIIHFPTSEGVSEVSKRANE